MDNQSNVLLSWAYYCQGKTMEELRQSLLYTTLELEQTKLVAQEELRKRDEQLIHFKEVLTKTVKERDEALEKCQRLIFDNLLLQQQQQQKNIAPPLSGASSIEDEQQPQQQRLAKQPGSNKSFSSSDCEESIVSPTVIDPVTNPPAQMEVSGIEITVPSSPDKPLPEKGKLLQAVLKAGPLLQTLLLAGPLPQWRHPPPPLETFEIPPVTVPPPPPPAPPQFQVPIVNNGCGKFNRKRVFSDGSYSPTETKYQKVLLH